MLLLCGVFPGTGDGLSPFSLNELSDFVKRREREKEEGVCLNETGYFSGFGFIELYPITYITYKISDFIIKTLVLGLL